MDDFRARNNCKEFERTWYTHVTPDPIPEIETLAQRGYVSDAYVSSHLEAPLLTIIYRDHYGSMVSTSDSHTYPVTDAVISQLFAQATRRLRVHLGEYRHE
jgi:hypothetical protein